MHPSYYVNYATAEYFRRYAAVFVLLIIWSLVWKGLALWRSARNGHSVWFVIILALNTLGILEIIYLLTAGKETRVSS